MKSEADYRIMRESSSPLKQWWAGRKLGQMGIFFHTPAIGLPGGAEHFPMGSGSASYSPSNRVIEPETVPELTCDITEIIAGLKARYPEVVLQQSPQSVELG